MDMQRAQAFTGGQTIASATIEIFGEINQDMRQRVEDNLAANIAARHLDIVIDSEGGDYWPSMAIYRAIRWAPALTKRVRMRRRCSSGAIVIAMAGDVRIAQRDTEIVLHKVGSFPSTTKRWTADDHAEAVRQQCAFDRKMLSLIAERTGASFEALTVEASNEQPSTMAWCLAHNFVDAVEEAK